MTASQNRILIVEDELYIAQSIQHILEKMGYEIIAPRFKPAHKA